MLKRTIVFFFLILVSLLMVGAIRKGEFVASDLIYSLITAAIATLVFNFIYIDSTNK